MEKLDKITIKGFKSIKELVDFELNEINIFIGANGAGKSNIISFFRMLNALGNNDLPSYIVNSGGAGDLLYNGRKCTEKMEFTAIFGKRGYRFCLVPTPKDNCIVESEARFYEDGKSGWWEFCGSLGCESSMVKEVNSKSSDAKYSKFIYDSILSWKIYHFHDTSKTAGMRHYEIVEDNKKLREDASNIAPFLLKLKKSHVEDYQNVLRSVRSIMPFFNDFILEPQDQERGGQKVNLSWTQKGSDYPMQPYHLSDGSIRFICLATALLQPYPPSTIIIDEPELGLHPAAIVGLSKLVQICSQKTQVIVATQSPALIDQFAIEDIVVVNKKNDGSTFKRLKEEDFSVWLEDYSIGELWTKNIIVGGPVYD